MGFFFLRMDQKKNFLKRNQAKIKIFRSKLLQKHAYPCLKLSPPSSSNDLFWGPSDPPAPDQELMMCALVAILCSLALLSSRSDLDEEDITVFLIVFFKGKVFNVVFMYLYIFCELYTIYSLNY